MSENSPYQDKALPSRIEPRADMAAEIAQIEREQRIIETFEQIALFSLIGNCCCLTPGKEGVFIPSPEYWSRRLH